MVTVGRHNSGRKLEPFPKKHASSSWLLLLPISHPSTVPSPCYWPDKIFSAGPLQPFLAFSHALRMETSLLYLAQSHLTDEMRLSQETYDPVHIMAFCIDYASRRLSHNVRKKEEGWSFITRLCVGNLWKQQLMVTSCHQLFCIVVPSFCLYVLVMKNCLIQNKSIQKNNNVCMYKLIGSCKVLTFL